MLGIDSEGTMQRFHQNGSECTVRVARCMPSPTSVLELTGTRPKQILSSPAKPKFRTPTPNAKQLVCGVGTTAAVHHDTYLRSHSQLIKLPQTILPRAYRNYANSQPLVKAQLKK